MIRRNNCKEKNNNVKSNDNNSKDSNLEVMNYLIQKLDFRQKKIIKFKNLFKELDSFESFYSQRKEIYLLLNNLEEDLKQAAYAIKALLLQNKSLIKDINTRILDNKNLSNELNITLGENENLKMQIQNLNINQNKMNEVINYNLNTNNNDLVNINIDSIKVDDEDEFDEPKIKNIDLKNNTNNVKINNYNYINKELIQENNYEQLSDVKNIMNEMRNNKRNLKKIIEEHFKEQNAIDTNQNIS